jgi:hypothetical protein
VLWLLLVFLRGLMRHCSLLWIAGIVALCHYMPTTCGAQATPGGRALIAPTLHVSVIV